MYNLKINFKGTVCLPIFIQHIPKMILIIQIPTQFYNKKIGYNLLEFYLYFFIVFSLSIRITVFTAVPILGEINFGETGRLVNRF